MPERIRLSRAKGWRMPPNTVKVDRSNAIWGNPFVVGEDGTAAECVAAYSSYIRIATGVPNGGGRPLIQQAPEVLGGKNLACWCKLDAPCHADVLLLVSTTVACRLSASRLGSSE